MPVEKQNEHFSDGAKSLHLCRVREHEHRIRGADMPGLQMIREAGVGGNLTQKQGSVLSLLISGTP